MFRFDEDGANQTLNDICSIIKNEQGHWFGTSFGLVRRHNGVQSFYNEANGFPNNTVHAILEDRRNNLWLSTNQGMVKFNTSTLTYQTFKHTNELKITEFSDGAFFRDEITGSLLF
ncbi:MAG: hypothetical protein LUD15_06110 [Bacteroides sp.]|nr:hypothetical protein [Bacteroides sp.]